MDDTSIKSYYATGFEKNRLELEGFKLEGLRTKEIISRYLTSKPMKILDVGGATGYYSFWLKEKGHQVSLVDLIAENITLAKAHAMQTELELDSYEIGDATKLNLPNDKFDLVLLMGPLYHLINKGDRLKALAEARRVLRPGGTVLVAVISRYASMLNGFIYNLISDKEFAKIVKRDLESGIHINHTDNPEYFTTAFFHTPDEIEEEIRSSGLQLKKLIAIESAGWMIPDFLGKTNDEIFINRILELIASVESNKDILAVSPHIMAIGVK